MEALSLHNARGFESKNTCLCTLTLGMADTPSTCHPFLFEVKTTELFLSHSFWFYYFHFVSLLLLFGFSVKVPGGSKRCPGVPDRFWVVPGGSE